MAKKAQVKNHKEKVEKNLFLKDYFVDSENGKSYPKDRLRVDYVSYTGEYLDRDEVYQDYQGDKVNITISKLINDKDWNIIVKQKALTNRKGDAYVVNDEKQVSISVDQYLEMLKDSDIDF